MKCPICSEEVVGDPISHIKTESHEVALAKLIDCEKSTPPNKVLHQTCSTCGGENGKHKLDCRVAHNMLAETASW